MNTTQAAIVAGFLPHLPLEDLEALRDRIEKEIGRRQSKAAKAAPSAERARTAGG